jgi:hypothetical protein
MADIEEKIQINRKIFTKRFDLSFFALAKKKIEDIMKLTKTAMPCVQ